MERHELLREEAREKLRQAASACDPQIRQDLAAAAFQLAQEAEALERATFDVGRAMGGRP